MRFPFTFTRYHGAVPAGGTAFGDAVPSTKGDKGSTDNFFELSTRDSCGNPITGFDFYFTGGSAVTFQFYVYDEALQGWVKLGAAVAAVVAATLTSFRSIPVPPDFAHAGDPSQNKCGGSLRVCVIASAATVDGAYVFAFVPTLNVNF